MNTRALAALAGVAFFVGGTAHAPAQTTAAPTAGPVAAPTTAPATPAIVKTMVPIPAPTGPGAMRAMPTPAIGPPALAARSLRAERTAAGYRLTGQALVKDACTAGRFSPSFLTIYPPQFDLVQYPRPGTMGKRCVHRRSRVTTVTAQPLDVGSAHPPLYVTVRTKKGVTRVPLPRPTP